MMGREYLGRGRFWFLAIIILAVVSYQVALTYSLLTLGKKRNLLGFEGRTVVGRNTALLVRKGDPAEVPTPAERAGLATGDRLLIARFPGEQAQPVVGLFAAMDALRKVEPGRPVALTVERDAAAGYPLFLTVDLVLPADIPWYEGLPVRSILAQVLLPLLCISAALLIGLARLENRNAFLASLLLFSFAGAAWAGGYGLFPPALRAAGLALYVTLFSWWSYLFMRFFLLFPTPSPLDVRLPWLKNVLAAFPVAFTLWNINWAYTEATSFAASQRLERSLGFLDVAQDLFFLSLFAIGFLALGQSIVKASTLTDRRRLVFLLAGSLGVIPALTSYFLRAVLGHPTVPAWFFYLSALGLALFPLFFAYAVFKHEVFGIRLMLRRGLQFAMLSKGILFAEGAIVFLALFYGLGPFIERMLHWTQPGLLALLTAFLTMGAVLLVRRVNGRLLGAIERRFFREAYDARIILMDLSRALRQLATEPFDLLRLVTSKVMDSLHPDQVTVFIKGAEAIRFPPPTGEADAAARNLGESHREDYLCLCWRAGGSSPSEPPAEFPSPLILPADSLTARTLAAVSTEEPTTLSMDLGDRGCWTSALLKAHPGENDPRLELALLKRIDPRLLVPFAANHRLIGFMALGEKKSEEPYSSEDKELILTVAQQVALALDYGEFIREEEVQINLRSELEIAKKVQEKLFPQTLPEVRGLDYTGICKPARGVGGDYYDFLELGEGKLGIALGDVAGKGISAALLMASLQAMLRIHADSHQDDLGGLTADINWQMCRAMDCSRFASFFFGVFDPVSRLLRYVNAGHNPPLLFSGGGGEGRDLGAQALRLVAEREDEVPPVRKLMPTGMVLGVSPEIVYRQDAVRLHRGDVLVIYTDGVSEAKSPADDEYGEDRLREIVHPNAWMSAEGIRDLILEDVNRFCGAASPTDDLTLIVAKATA